MLSRLALEGQVFIVVIVQEGSFVRATEKLGSSLLAVQTSDSVREGTRSTALR